MALAALVASDGADAGLGIFAAAKAQDLDFIPVGQEEYDFALEPASLDLPLVQAFLTLLQDPGFHGRLSELGGYTLDRCGEIILAD
jgi:putative molybdopterin biosynthesis protein